MMHDIPVYRTDAYIALEHGMELWWDNSTQESRLDQRNGRDGFTRYCNARVEGKLAEVAFSRFLYIQYDIESQVDWRIYGSYTQTDHGDLQYIVGDDGEKYQSDVEFDIKKTKPYNQWLLVRDEIFDRHEDNAPFILTKLSLEEDIIVDKFESYNDWDDVQSSHEFQQLFDEWTDGSFPKTVQLVGSAYPSEFTDHFKKGEQLYDPETGQSIGSGLRRPNHGIHVTDLVNTTDRWNRIVEEIIGDNPVSYTDPTA